MSSAIPPNPYFNNINFNPSFFSVIQTYLTEAIANSKYLKLIGGTISGFLGIGRTARVELDVNGKAVINNDLTAPPAVGQFGGNGTKLILFDGNATEAPYAIGVDTSTLWYGTNTAGSHKFYTGTTERMRIKNDGNVGIGVSDPIQKLQIRGSNPTTLRIETDTSAVGQVAGIEFGIPSFTTAGSAKITSTSIAGNIADLQFSTSSGTNSSTVKMTIMGNGSVGIGTTNPNANLHIHSPNTNSYVTFNITDATSGTTGSDGIGIVKTDVNDMILTVRENAKMSFYTNNILQMTLTNAGNLGIGTPTPGSYKLNVNGSTYLDSAIINATLIVGNNNSYPDIRIGPANGNNIAIATTGGSYSSSSAANDMVIRSINKMILQSGGGAAAIIINTNNNIGIGSVIPNNILQVGDGGRLRISNGTTDYTLIGTKETDDTNNTSICLSAYTRAGFNGRIEYNSTTNGGHLFNVNNIRIIEVFNTGINITRSITTYGANYYSTGTYIAKSNKVKSGSLITYYGFFLDAANFSNCMVHLSASHSSPNYTFWHGRVVYNNVNIVVNLASYAASNMTVEEFIENGTNLKYIIIYPTIAYTNETNVRINFYS